MPDPFPRIAAMLAAEDDFDALVRLGDLDPAADFIGADLRHVRFGPSLNGADLSGADLRGTNIGEVAPGYFISAATRLPSGATLRRPADFDEDQVPAMLVAGEALPRTWLPFIKKINLGGETEFFRLASLAGCFNLERLDADGTKVADLSPLQGLTQLQGLSLNGTSVSDLSPLQGLTQLRVLWLDRTSVSDLSPLADFIAKGLKVHGKDDLLKRLKRRRRVGKRSVSHHP